MQISFLLGAAGTGKTYRCLSEIRSVLRSFPRGAPLIFIAPKQSTYQLERQLLEQDGLSGYARLQILSFERLAQWVFAERSEPMPQFLSEQGRTMVLRALLTRLDGQLTIFRSAARRLGFAEEVSKQIREFQNHGLSPASLRRLASEIGLDHGARDKLLDLALIYERYASWLAERALQDGDALLTAATELLEKSPGEISIAGLWVDGFAQLTPQELKFLVTVIGRADKATLAFCLEANAKSLSTISASHLVSQTVSRCRAALEQRYGAGALRIDELRPNHGQSRFSSSPVLQHLERNWNSGASSDLCASDTLRVVQAADAEGEAMFVAREIVRHVRAGGRYREVALLLRDLQNDYPHVLRRVFQRYEIPFFLDHREGVAHHPLAELTRGALRTVAFNWKHQDWFATLKCGLMRKATGQMRGDEQLDLLRELDLLENEALAHGWNGAAWRTGLKLPNDSFHEKKLNRLRERLIQPFVVFASRLPVRPGAEQLAAAIRELWETLGAQPQLELWSKEDPASAVHLTVWEQMTEWLKDLELAFRGQQMPLVDWLPVIEAGLRNLTVGVVPPVLDQVLIGSVDRSRNPDLKVLFVLGVNERVFPAAVARDTLLSEDDREALMTTGCSMGEAPAWRMAGEQFYGYIACTRPRERLALSFSRASMDGTPLNPSRFISQVQRIFPGLVLNSFAPPSKLEEVVHPCELTAIGILRQDDPERTELTVPAVGETLDADLAQRLYGDELSISVSSLERFAACPYRFFVEQGLGVRERQEFLLDVREQGSFQHEVLAKFHEELRAEGLKWRDLSPAEGRARIGRIADEVMRDFHGGLLMASEQNRFTAETYKATLQEFMSVLIGWFATNQFDPEAVEFGFGRDSGLPGWKVEMGDGRAVVIHGRVDRIDLHRKSETEACCVIVDYKSGLQKPDKTLLHHGIQQQLPAYLLAITRVPEIAAAFQVKSITAAGCFILPLSAQQNRSKNRREALADADEARRLAYSHEGIFDVDHLALLDASAPAEKSGQFKFRLTNAGQPYGNTFNALKTPEFGRVLARSEELIRDFGRRIYAGEIAIHPYKKGSVAACGRCHFQPVCRFDSWTQKYNVLLPPEKLSAERSGL